MGRNSVGQSQDWVEEQGDVNHLCYDTVHYYLGH